MTAHHLPNSDTAATAASEASSMRHRVAWKLHLHLELGGGFGSRPFCQGEAYV